MAKSKSVPKEQQAVIKEAFKCGVVRGLFALRDTRSKKKIATDKGTILEFPDKKLAKEFRDKINSLNKQEVVVTYGSGHRKADSGS